MRFRAFVVVVVGAQMLLASGPSAAAPTRPICRLLVDEVGDEKPPVSDVPTGGAPSLDIVSGDVATDATRLTGVIRVAQLRLPEPAAASGIRYELAFHAGDDRFSLIARVGADATRFVLTLDGGQEAGGVSLLRSTYLTDIEGVLDEDAGEIRMTAPLSAFDAHYPIRSGDELWGLDAEAAYAVGTTEPQASVSQSADIARNELARYPVGAPSCARVGH